jgi:hypothetical protein
MVVAVVANESWNKNVTKVDPISSPDASTNQFPKATNPFEYSDSP